MCLYHKQRARDHCVPAFSNHIASAALRSVPFNSVPSAFVLQSTLTPPSSADSVAPMHSRHGSLCTGRRKLDSFQRLARVNKGQPA